MAREQPPTKRASPQKSDTENLFTQRLLDGKCCARKKEKLLVRWTRNNANKEEIAWLELHWFFWRAGC